MAASGFLTITRVVFAGVMTSAVGVGPSPRLSTLSSV